MHVAGYDIVSSEGYAKTLQHIDQTIGLHSVPVWHCNDARAKFGSKLDRHEHIGRGTIELEPFRRLLNDPRLQRAAFIAETPIDAPGDDLRNVEALKHLVAETSGEEGLRAKVATQKAGPRRRSPASVQFESVRRP
jgi:deoxyribonuclease-4